MGAYSNKYGKMFPSIAKCLEWKISSTAAQEKWKMWSLKASVGRISACACLRKFSTSLVLCWLLCFYFISIIKSPHGTDNYSKGYLFSVVLNISYAFHWKLFHLCWVHISCKILVDAASYVYLMVCFSFIPRLWWAWSIPRFPSWATFKEREKTKNE